MADLHEILLEKQEGLARGLEAARKLLSHHGSKGEVSEEDWAEAIRDFLPKRYTVSTKTTVIDSNGDESDLLDVVVHDSHFCPLFFERGGVKLIPSESVFAVFEAKQEIDKGVVEYTHEKVKSVRRLHRTSVGLVDRGVLKPGRDPFDILGGLLALESGWSPPFGESFISALNLASAEERIDIGCVIRDGSFDVTRSDEDEKIEIATDGVLMFFLLRLFARLQGIGSPMGIDLRAYSRPLTDGGAA